MKIDKLERYLGKRVRVFLDDRELCGTLQKTRTEEVKRDINLYHYKPNYYVVISERGGNSVLFRASYVRKVVVLDEHKKAE